MEVAYEGLWPGKTHEGTLATSLRPSGLREVRTPYKTRLVPTGYRQYKDGQKVDDGSHEN